MFQKSRFYRQVMVNIGCEYGASIVAWRQGTWLANLSIFRTEAQGDFLDSEEPILEACHAHFESAVKRIASLRESQLGSHSLEAFIWSLPTAALVLDWNLKLLHYNAAAQDLIGIWRLGERSSKMKKSRSLVVSGDILALIEKRKDALAEIRSNRPGAPTVIPIVEIKHPTLAGLSANVSFLPSKSLAHSKGTFLIALHRYQPTPDASDSYDRFASLSRRERDVVRGATLGKTNDKIARELGTSANTVRMQLHKAYRKLGIQSRYQLMAVFSKSPLLSAPADAAKTAVRS
jgi:DNA-binding CsgD family transcriptional regulator